MSTLLYDYFIDRERSIDSVPRNQSDVDLFERRFFRRDDFEGKNVVIGETDAIVFQSFKFGADVALFEEPDVDVKGVAFYQPGRNGFDPELHRRHVNEKASRSHFVEIVK